MKGVCSNQRIVENNHGATIPLLNRENRKDLNFFIATVQSILNTICACIGLAVYLVCHVLLPVCIMVLIVFPYAVSITHLFSFMRSEVWYEFEVDPYFGHHPCDDMPLLWTKTEVRQTITTRKVFASVHQLFFLFPIIVVAAIVSHELLLRIAQRFFWMKSSFEHRQPRSLQSPEQQSLFPTLLVLVILGLSYHYAPRSLEKMNWYVYLRFSRSLYKF